jgi:DNA-binding FadR family transcriptional regulator
MKRVAAVAPAKRRPPLHQMVQSRVKDHIIENGLGPGDPLPPESELAQELEVSRGSVREAVKALEVLGIVDVRHGTGLFVKDFSFDPIFDNLPYAVLSDLKQVVDILEVRFHLERATVERVIEALTEEQLEELRDIMRRMEGLAQQGVYSADEDRAFHECLCKNLDNPVLVRIVNLFWELSRQAKDRAELPDPSDPMETYRRHVPIMEALERRDARAMRAAITTGHIVGVTNRLIAAGAPNAERLVSLFRSGHDADLESLDSRQSAMPSDDRTGDEGGG